MDQRRRSAFTLIEIMIVIVLIGILIGILLPHFQGVEDEASETRVMADLRTLATAIESYRRHNSTLPGSLAVLATATPRLISTVPNDPFRTAGTDYSYAKDTNGVYYVVWSYGRDRASSITGVDPDGTLSGGAGDDPFMSNGTGTF